MDGYYLRGVDDEFILVLRAYDHEKILKAIERLATERDDISELAIKLKEEFYDQYRNGVSAVAVEPCDKKKVNARKRGKSRKA